MTRPRMLTNRRVAGNPVAQGTPARTPFAAASAATILASLLACGACGPPAPLTKVRTSDGFTIAVDVEAPPDIKKAPLVVLCHQQFEDRTSWDPLVPKLLEKKWAVLRVDHRGFGESRLEVASPTDLSEAQRDSFHVDILAAIDSAAKRPGIDASRVAIVASGFSVGFAARCARLDSRVKALVLVSGYIPSAEEDFLIAHPDFPVFLAVATTDVQGAIVMRQHADRLRGPMQELIEIAPVADDSAKWVGTEGLTDEIGLADLIVWKLETMFPPQIPK